MRKCLAGAIETGRHTGRVVCDPVATCKLTATFAAKPQAAIGGPATP